MEKILLSVLNKLNIKCENLTITINGKVQIFGKEISCEDLKFELDGSVKLKNTEEEL